MREEAREGVLTVLHVSNSFEYVPSTAIASESGMGHVRAWAFHQRDPSVHHSFDMGHSRSFSAECITSVRPSTKGLNTMMPEKCRAHLVRTFADPVLKTQTFSDDREGAKESALPSHRSSNLRSSIAALERTGSTLSIAKSVAPGYAQRSQARACTTGGDGTW